VAVQISFLILIEPKELIIFNSFYYNGPENIENAFIRCSHFTASQILKSCRSYASFASFNIPSVFHSLS